MTSHIPKDYYTSRPAEHLLIASATLITGQERENAKCSWSSFVSLFPCFPATAGFIFLNFVFKLLRVPSRSVGSSLPWQPESCWVIPAGTQEGLPSGCWWALLSFTNEHIRFCPQQFGTRAAWPRQDRCRVDSKLLLRYPMNQTHSWTQFWPRHPLPLLKAVFILDQVC